MPHFDLVGGGCFHYGRMGERLGWRRLPKKLPRPTYAAVYILLLLTAITSLSVVIVPRLTVSA